MKSRYKHMKSRYKQVFKASGKFIMAFAIGGIVTYLLFGYKANVYTFSEQCKNTNQSLDDYKKNSDFFKAAFKGYKAGIKKDIDRKIASTPNKELENGYNICLRSGRGDRICTAFRNCMIDSVIGK